MKLENIVVQAFFLFFAIFFNIIFILLFLTIRGYFHALFNLALCVLDRGYIYNEEESVQPF